VPGYDLKLYTEYNLPIAILSNRSTAMPDVEMSLTCTALLGLDPMPDVPVTFETEDSDLIELIGDTGIQTDSRGQARVLVRGTGIGTGDAVVKCLWQATPNLRLTREVTITLVESKWSNAPATPVWIEALLTPCLAGYYDFSTIGGPFVLTAVSQLNDTNGFRLKPGPSLRVTVYEYCDPLDSRFAYTTEEVDSPLRRIWINKAMCDGDPTSAECPTFFARLAWRHDMQNIVSHEWGHAIGLDHNSIISSLMWPGRESYFVWKISQPVACDLSTIHALYPPCP